MNSLIIDSTADRLIIVLIKDKTVFSYTGNKDARRHTGMILTVIDELIEKAGISPKDIGIIGAVTGPGSFTGIRIGVATANALAYAVGAKIVELTSLESAAYGKDEALVLLDCKHNNFYALKRCEGKDEYMALSEAESRDIDLPKIYAGETDIDNLVAVFNKKVLEHKFSERAVPFYLKKSSAELL